MSSSFLGWLVIKKCVCLTRSPCPPSTHFCRHTRVLIMQPAPAHGASCATITTWLTQRTHALTPPFQWCEEKTPRDKIKLLNLNVYPENSCQVFIPIARTLTLALLGHLVIFCERGPSYVTIIINGDKMRHELDYLLLGIILMKWRIYFQFAALPLCLLCKLLSISKPEQSQQAWRRG